jgi:hypothetical protein
MVTAKQIKQAAETIDGLSAVVEHQRAALKTANATIASMGAVKTAAATAAVDTRRLAGLAKKAAASLLQNGLISTPERAETFAAEISDPAKALIALEKFAAHTGTARKVAAVVPDHALSLQESADDVWDRHATNFVPAAK